MTSLIYNTGTVSVSHGSPVVEGNLTGWAVALVQYGIFSCEGLAIPVLNDPLPTDTSLTLAYPWPGSDASGKPYALFLNSEQAGSAVWTHRTLADILRRGSLWSITPKWSGTLTDRDALDLDVDDAGQYFGHAEADHDLDLYLWSGAAWIGPFSSRGDKGDAAPLSSLNDLSDVSITSPENGKVLRYDGSAWVDGKVQINDVDGAGALASKDALTADDIDDSTSDHKFASADQLGKLGGLPTAVELADALGDKVDVVALAAHVTDDDNPHGVTADQVGLGNVDNTSDADKPVSTAQAAAMYKAATLAPVAERLVPAEPAAAAFDLLALAGLVRDDEDRAKSWAGDVNDKIPYVSPSTKYVGNRAGILVPGTTLRCDHDPATRAARGVRLECQSTNRFLQSHNFSSSSWTKFVTAWSYSHNDTEIAAPDGTFTASRIERIATGNSIFLRSAQGPVSVAQGTELTISFFIYYPSGSAFDLTLDDDQTGKLMTINAAPRWQRISVPWTKGSGGQGYVDFQAAPPVGTIFWFWGAQVEQRPFSTSYIATGASQVTRAADLLRIPLPELPFNTAAGTLLVDCIVDGVGSAETARFSLESSNDNRISIRTLSGGTDAFIRADGVNVWLISSTPFVLPARQKLALGWDSSGVSYVVNGALVVTKAISVLPIGLTHLVSTQIGINQTLGALGYLPRRMSVAEMQSWTAL